MIRIGELSLWVALLMAAWAATVSFAGGALGRRDLVISGERAIGATLLMVALASAGLWTALFTHDFSIAYVASYASANLPKLYLFSALWAGPAGTMLLWALLLAGGSSIAVYASRNRDIIPFVSGTLATLLLFLLAAICFGAKPFERLDWIPPDGRSLDPVLQNPGFAVHPPSVYLGCIASAIPFAFAIGQVVSRKRDITSSATIEKWAAVAWLFSTAGVLLGMRWAYMEPGWGARWVLHPVENASLLPWLVNTALLHSIRRRDERGVLHTWNVLLVVSAFILSIVALLMTQRVLVAGVHSSSAPPARIWLAGFLAVALFAATWFVSRRAGAGSKPRRYTTYVGHAGAVVMLAALAGLAFRRDFEIALNDGGRRELVDPFGSRWTFVSQGLSQYDALNRHVTALALDARRDGKAAGLITSEQREYFDGRGAPTFGPSVEPGIRASWKQDVHVEFIGVREDGSSRIRVAFTPLVRWIWLGGGLMLLGGLMATWMPEESGT